ncbi:MAG TPA: ferrous iron transport protein A [Candidatus Acidoferrales bacterium]|jgi:hypothetical protein|nr:ferrous iron transport protein A [Candidatus Acidoferrales bacterium]
MNSKTKKLLIIGSANYDRNKEGLRIESIPWNKLFELENVSDYDLLVINLLGIKGEAERESVDWAKFQSLFDFVAATDILTHDGKIIILGDPRFYIPHWQQEDGERPFLYWSGVKFTWDGQPGDTIQYAQSGVDEFAEFRRHFRRWDYSLQRAEPDEFAIKERWDLRRLEAKGITPDVRVITICTNRYRKPLVFQIRHRFADAYDREVSNYGPILFLPDVGFDEGEMIQLVLRDFCDAATNLPEPAWMKTYPAPGQKVVDEKISQIQIVIAEQTAALEKAEQDRARVRTCLKLLYEREFGLEPVVREVLRQLGAKIEDPAEKNKEDGWVTVEVGGIICEGVLEIKSTKSDQFGEDGRKQLLDWIDRGRTLRHKNYKGIFVGNSAVAKPLKDRPDAFSDNWKKAAALSQICALKSEDLYFIHLLNSEKKLNLDDFWKQLFSTNGIFNISPYLPKPAETKKPSKG